MAFPMMHIRSENADKNRDRIVKKEVLIFPLRLF